MRKLVAIFFLTLAACSSRSATLHGSVLNPAPAAPDFSLVDQSGSAYQLSQSRGQAVALYFGFTHCTDVCGPTLAMLGKARTEAGISAHELRIVMVTVDPSRDSGHALQTFFRRVGVVATGLRGSQQALQQVYRAYGVAVKPEKRDIVHTETIFLIDGSGRLRELLDPTTPIDFVAADLRAVAS
jgi:protein SCO1/2